MMNDRELLELAAKAVGYQPWGSDCEGYPIFVVDSMPIDWNPLQYDGDALRLAVKLGLTLRLNQFDEWTQVFAGDCYARTTPAVSEHIGRTREEQTIEQATRRAIVRAAAEIGKAMQEKH